ncbi:hypothetical protein [Halosimplex sp. TS25]|uniref:hypothetical protein n=1 Tax=Halosimplex rarum TaxID=3396619 RepID=UPI0039E98547
MTPETMARYRITCESCSFGAEAASIAEALTKERAHKSQVSVEHRVAIERCADA